MRWTSETPTGWWGRISKKLNTSKVVSTLRSSSEAAPSRFTVSNESLAVKASAAAAVP